jgi:hypothetical protein
MTSTTWRHLVPWCKHRLQAWGFAVCCWTVCFITRRHIWSWRHQCDVTYDHDVNNVTSHNYDRDVNMDFRPHCLLLNCLFYKVTSHMNMASTTWLHYDYYVTNVTSHDHDINNVVTHDFDVSIDSMLCVLLLVCVFLNQHTALELNWASLATQCWRHDRKSPANAIRERTSKLLVTWAWAIYVTWRHNMMTSEISQHNSTLYNYVRVTSTLNMCNDANDTS